MQDVSNRGNLYQCQEGCGGHGYMKLHAQLFCKFKTNFLKVKNLWLVIMKFICQDWKRQHVYLNF